MWDYRHMWQQQSNWIHCDKPDSMLHWTQGAHRLSAWLDSGVIDEMEYDTLMEVVVTPLAELG